jgi:HSP20 family protein
MLMRTDPFRELDRVAQQVFGTSARPAAMPIDAYRKGDEFVVMFDLPGVDPNSINLTVERNVLTVHAERGRPEENGVELLIGERPQGTFSRQLFLAETLDTERIAAEYTDGVLTLRVPVREQAKPRRVDISVGRGKQSAISAEARSGHADSSHADSSHADQRQPAGVGA